MHVDAHVSPAFAPGADADAVLRALKNPRAAAKAFVKWDAEQSLLNFVKLMWFVNDPGEPLVVGWAMQAMCEHLEAVHRGEILRLLTNVPPGTSKSTLFNVMFQAYEWGPKNRSDKRYISWAYGSHLTERDNERCRKIISSPLYQALWGDRVQFDAKQNAKAFYKTTRGGFRIASSIDGVGTGERGDHLTYDDPHSVSGGDSEAELRHVIDHFSGTLTTRVRNSDDRERFDAETGLVAKPSSIAIIMQRVTMGDVSGVIIAKDLGYEHLLIEMEYEGTGHPRRRMFNWKPSRIGYSDPREARVKFANAQVERIEETVDDEWWKSFLLMWAAIGKDIAILCDPVRFPRHVVERDKRIMLIKQGTNAVASQFRQWPFDTSGAMFKREWFKDKIIKWSQLPPAMDLDVRAWDFASSTSKKADRTATVASRLGTDRNLYIMHADARRLSPGAVEEWVKERIVFDREQGFPMRVRIPKDPAQAGESQVHYYSKNVFQGVDFIAERVIADKKVRARPLAAQAEHGNVYLVEGDWNDMFLDELCSFPVGDHDDLVDAASDSYDAHVKALEFSESYMPIIVTEEY